jgi:hypothetical protein
MNYDHQTGVKFLNSHPGKETGTTTGTLPKAGMKTGMGYKDHPGTSKALFSAFWHEL